MPKFYTADVDGLYQAIRASLRDKYHQPGLTIDGRNIPADQYQDGDAHASDGYIVQGNYASNDGGRTWTHLERLTK